MKFFEYNFHIHNRTAQKLDASPSHMIKHNMLDNYGLMDARFFKAESSFSALSLSRTQFWILFAGAFLEQVKERVNER